jgi:S-adenosylmethionine hydrolase
MSSPLITLTTDFGESSPYVAAMKGVILSMNPRVRLIDLTHSIPPQSITGASYFLTSSVDWFPDKTIHVVVVDPGVGTSRNLLLARSRTQWFLAPDNGCWKEAAESLFPDEGTLKVWKLDNPKFWLPSVSKTFHGRDILAPVAAHLSLGISPGRLGTPLTPKQYVHHLLPAVRVPRGQKRMEGEIIFVDTFGNLITNIPEAMFEDACSPPLVQVAGREISGLVETYGNASAGQMVALIGSSSALEIAVVNGNASRELGVGVGAPVVVTPQKRKKA